MVVRFKTISSTLNTAMKIKNTMIIYDLRFDHLLQRNAMLLKLNKFISQEESDECLSVSHNIYYAFFT